MVDKFVLVESSYTFHGAAKPLYFEDHKERFAAFLHKIVHVKVHETSKPADLKVARSYHRS